MGEDDSGDTTTKVTDNLAPWLSRVPVGHPDTMMSVESVRRAVQEFQTQPSDVIVTTFAKTGTTLVTFLAHLLRTGAHPDSSLQFECFYDVVPWPLLSWDIGVDPNTATPPQLQPRIFKSHLRLASIYRGSKYVVTIRDPAAVGTSFYRYFLAKQVPFIAELKNVTEFLCDTHFVQGRSDRPSLWEYYEEYHAALSCPDVLVLVYEDLCNETTKRTCVQQLAAFMGLPADAALIDRTMEMSTKQAMAPLNERFDEPYERAKQLGRVGDLAQLAPGHKVSSSSSSNVDDRNKFQLDERAEAFLQQKWKEHMVPLGYESYQTFANAIREVNRRRV